MMTPKVHASRKGLPISVDNPNRRISRIRNEKLPSRAANRPNAGIANGKATFPGRIPNSIGTICAATTCSASSE